MKSSIENVFISYCNAPLKNNLADLNHVLDIARKCVSIDEELFHFLKSVIDRMCVYSKLPAVDLYDAYAEELIAQFTGKKAAGESDSLISWTFSTFYPFYRIPLALPSSLKNRERLKPEPEWRENFIKKSQNEMKIPAYISCQSDFKKILNKIIKGKALKIDLDSYISICRRCHPPGAPFLEMPD